MLAANRSERRLLRGERAEIIHFLLGEPEGFCSLKRLTGKGRIVNILFRCGKRSERG